MPPRQPKEAIYVVLDVGEHMSSPCDEASSKSCFEQSLNMIDLLIQRKLFQEYKGVIGLILINSDQTANSLYSASQRNSQMEYEHITVAQPLSLLNWDILKYLRTNVNVGDRNSVDIVDAIVVAGHHMKQEVAVLESSHSIRRILLFTNFKQLNNENNSQYDSEQINAISKAFSKQNISVDVICPSCIEKQVDQNTVTDPVLKLVQSLIQATDGSFYAYNEAAETLNKFEGRLIRPSPTHFSLQIGSSLELPVSMYIKVRESKPAVLKFSKVFKRNPEVEIETKRRYVRRDDPETALDDEDIATGYMYGSTFVPFDKDDAEILFDYDNERGLKLIGFCPLSNIKPHLFTSAGVYQVVPSTKVATTVKMPTLLYSALLASLYETESAAIVRKVYRKGCQPEIGAMIPAIKDSCFYYYRLPFAQDAKECEFKKDTSKFTESQLNAVDRLIDSLNMCPEESEEILRPQNTFNPAIQTIFKCLSARFIDPKSSIEPILAQENEVDAQILKFCRREELADVINQLKSNFDVRPIGTSEKTAAELFEDRQFSRQTSGVAAMSGDSLEIDIFRELAPALKIGSLTPHTDFTTLVQQNPEQLIELSADLFEILKKLIEASSDQIAYFDRAINCWCAMREACLTNNQAQVFNELLKQFKMLVQNSDSYAEFWTILVNKQITLINRDENSSSYVLPEEARLFLDFDEGLGTVNADEEEMDEEDLLDLM